MIENHITQQFLKANVNFVGWKDCPNDIPKDVKPIEWMPSGGFDAAAGISGSFGFNPSQIQKPVSFSKTGNVSWCPGKPYLESNCLLNVALHEFGHVVGLHHEMNRADISPRQKNKFCHDQMSGDGETAAMNLGEPDPNSIMNYCHVYAGNKKSELLRLSFFDIFAVYTLFQGVHAMIELPYGGDQRYLTPKTISLKNLPIYVYGDTISHYRYRWTGAKSLCHQSKTPWSDWIPKSNPIGLQNIPLKNGKPLTYELLKLCVLGKMGDRIQLGFLPTSIVFSIDQGESDRLRP